MGRVTADMWKNHFADILNGVNDESLKDDVLNQLDNIDTNTAAFSVQEVMNSINELSSGRSSGCDELNAEHFKFAGIPCAAHLSLCFSMMISHKFLPPSLSKVILNPIVKDITIRLSIFLTLAQACDKRFSADHDTMLSLLIKAFGPWAFTFYQTVFLSYSQKGSGQNI